MGVPRRHRVSRRDFLDTVFIRGQIRKWQGRLVDVDLNCISRLVNQSQDYVVSENG